MNSHKLDIKKLHDQWRVYLPCLLKVEKKKTKVGRHISILAHWNHFRSEKVSTCEHC